MLRAQGAGWAVIGPDPRIAAWAQVAHALACAQVSASTDPWRCGGTWFVGVDALPNDASGAVSGVDFPWAALPLAPLSLHPGQISVIRPGYPQPSASETSAAFAYRQRRDAAHLDGVLAIGPDQLRMVKEPHAWVLGLPLNHAGAGASPLVLWEGSHEVMRAALQTAFAPHPPETWGEVDVTPAYQAARRIVFDTCRRVELPVVPGEASLIHRLTLHGVAPWQDGAAAAPEGRMIAYFRPQMSSVAAWLQDA